MQMLRLYATSDGESHFDTIEYSMNLLDDSPPAKPHWFTHVQPAKSWVYLRCPVGWDGGLHPTREAPDHHLHGWKRAGVIEPRRHSRTQARECRAARRYEW